MADLADLYPGCDSHWLNTSAGKIFARLGGSGPPLLLLHGHPQSNAMWHRVAPELAPHFALVIADLPGYGWSAVPQAQEDHSPYTKRAMATAMVEALSAVTLQEAAIVVAGKKRNPTAAHLVDDLVRDLNVEVVPLGIQASFAAREAYFRFGRGYHPAKLNFADCLAYALAKTRSEPLLFKGHDFLKTDIVPAWRPQP